MAKPRAENTANTHDCSADQRSLVEQLRRGDPESYEVLAARYSGRMLSVATRILRNEEDARDTLQDSLLKAFQSVHSFRGESTLSTWLHRIVVNMALMKLRASKRRSQASLEDWLPGAEETASSHSYGPELMFLRDEEAATVRDCIARLPATSRTVVLLRDIAGLDSAETAKRLAITENAVKIRLHKARRNLMTLLRGEEA